VVLYLTVVPLPPGKTPFAVQLNNNNNNKFFNGYDVEVGQNMYGNELETF
jgi:hypothetical protein